MSVAVGRQTQSEIWLSPTELPVWRRLLACVAVVGAMGAWNLRGPAPVVGLLALVVPILGMQLRLPWAQLAARASLCTGLLLGFGLEAKPFGAAAATVALLALGGAGLRERDRLSGRSFHGELTVLVVAASAGALLIALDVLDSRSYLAAHPRRAWVRIGTWVALAAAIVGAHRGRTWGVLALVVVTGLCTFVACLGHHRVGGYVLWEELAAERWVVLFAVIAFAAGSIAHSLRTRAFPTLLDRFGARFAYPAFVALGTIATLRHAF